MAAKTTKFSAFLKHPLTTNPFLSALLVGVILLVVGDLSLHFYGSWINPPPPLKAAFQTPPQPVVVKVKSSIEEFKASSTASPPAFVAHKISSLPSSFRGTVTYKQGLISGSGRNTTQSTLFYQLSITSRPETSPDKPLSTAGTPARRRLYRRFNYGNQLYARGSVKGAAEFRFIIDTAPSFAEAHNNYGVTLFQQGRVQEAELEWREALKLDPTNALYNLNYKKAVARTGLFVGMFISMDVPLPDREPKANFMVSDLLEGPIYNVLVRDAFFSGSPPTVVENGFRDHIGGISVLPKRTALFCDSPYGELLPYTPPDDRNLEIQVTYSLSPAGLPQTRAFLFVPRQDQKGIWHWYPNLDEALTAEAQQDALDHPLRSTAILPFLHAPSSPVSP